MGSGEDNQARVGATWSRGASVRLAGELGDALHERGADVVLVKLGWRFAP